MLQIPVELYTRSSQIPACKNFENIFTQAYIWASEDRSRKKSLKVYQTGKALLPPQVTSWGFCSLCLGHRPSSFSLMQHWGFIRKNGKSGNICIAAGNTLLPFPAKMMISNRSRLSVFLERTSAASLTVSRFWKQLISSRTLRDMFRPRSVKSTFKAFLKCWMRQKKRSDSLQEENGLALCIYLFLVGFFFGDSAKANSEHS